MSLSQNRARVLHSFRDRFLVDFVEAENSAGFHADQEAVRVLALSLDYARRGQNALRDWHAARADSGRADEPEAAAATNAP